MTTPRRRWDVAVVGLGPAGRALAHRLAAHGARVAAFDPAPDRRWDHTLGGWTWQLPTWLPDDVVGVRLPSPVLRTPVERPMADTYAIFDNAGLQACLHLADVDVYADALTDPQILALHELAGAVVDARGMRPAGHDHLSAYQNAFGIKVDADLAAPFLNGRAAVLMDWTAPTSDIGPGNVDSTRGEPPSFLYVMPLPDGDVLLEETHVAGRPAASVGQLRRRLVARLRRAGIDDDAWRDAPVEVVRIPLERRGPQLPGVVRFGAAGAQSNPISGYSVAASLQRCDDVVADLAAGRRPADQTSPLARAALEAVLRLDARDTVALFDGFAQLSAHDQRAILDPHSSTSDRLGAMARQAAQMAWPAQRALVGATARGAKGLVGAPTWHGAPGVRHGTTADMS